MSAIRFYITSNINRTRFNLMHLTVICYIVFFNLHSFDKVAFNIGIHNINWFNLIAIKSVFKVGVSLSIWINFNTCKEFHFLHIILIHRFHSCVSLLNKVGFINTLRASIRCLNSVILTISSTVKC